MSHFDLYNGMPVNLGWIDVRRPADVAWWCWYFGVKERTLRTCVRSTGARVDAVAGALSQTCHVSASAAGFPWNAASGREKRYLARSLCS
jgi:hypothetical protein